MRKGVEISIRRFDFHFITFLLSWHIALEQWCKKESIVISKKKWGYGIFALLDVS